MFLTMPIGAECFVRRQWITETRTPGVWTTSIPTGWVGQGNLAKLLVKCKQTPSAECEIWPFCLQGPNLCVEHVIIDTYLNVYIQYICYSSIPFLPTTAWRKWLMSRWVSLGFQHFRGSVGNWWKRSLDVPNTICTGPFSCDFLQVMTAAAETATAQVPCD